MKKCCREAMDAGYGQGVENTQARVVKNIHKIKAQGVLDLWKRCKGRGNAWTYDYLKRIIKKLNNYKLSR